MASAEAARKISLRVSGQADVLDSPPRLRPALGGDNGCEFGRDCLIKPRNWPAFHNWILRSVASLIPDGLREMPSKRWELLRKARDPDQIAKIAEDCAECSRYVENVIERVKTVTLSGPLGSV